MSCSFLAFSTATTAVLLLAGTAVTSAEASTTAKTYANCTALNKVYPHGVGKTGAVDRVRGSTKPVTNFTRNNAAYAANTKSDRDGDKVACEKR
jgi:endonuclease YncB( thermonuclease family)